MSNKKTGSLRVKRVYDPPAKDDGWRVLVDRLWPRGLSKSDAALDEWARDIAPSPQVRKAFDHQAERFDDFVRDYRKELDGSAGAAEYMKSWLARLENSNLTLLFSARDPKLNQAQVLCDWLCEKMEEQE